MALVQSSTKGKKKEGMKFFSKKLRGAHSRDLEGFDVNSSEAVDSVNDTEVIVCNEGEIHSSTERLSEEENYSLKQRFGRFGRITTVLFSVAAVGIISLFGSGNTSTIRSRQLSYLLLREGKSTVNTRSKISSIVPISTKHVKGYNRSMRCLKVSSHIVVCVTGFSAI